MQSTEFGAEDWIERLARALGKLSAAQEPYLQEYYRQHPGGHVLLEERGGKQPAFALDDCRDLYAMAHHSHVLREEEYYAPLCAVLDPAWNILRSHPMLARVVSPIIGQDEFRMEILNTGQSTSSGDLIAGLMACAAELSGDRFRTAAGELNALLDPAAEKRECAGVPGGLDVGYDAVLFYGLTLKERIDIAHGMALLPFEQVRAFVDKSLVDKSLVEELTPRGAVFYGWRSVGAVVRPFRWRPVFSRPGYLSDRDPRRPHLFFREAQVFLELLAVAQATPVLSIATLGECIDRSAGRLLGLEAYCGSEYGRRSAQRFEGFEECPGLSSDALDQARAAFESRRAERYAQVGPIVSRLSEALARGEGFADEMRIVDIAIALENMYDLPKRKISPTLQNRASGYLGTDCASRDRIKESVKEFYDARSNIVHGGRGNVTQERNREVFSRGFDIARRTLFKLLQ